MNKNVYFYISYSIPWLFCALYGFYHLENLRSFAIYLVVVLLGLTLGTYFLNKNNNEKMVFLFLMLGLFASFAYCMYLKTFDNLLVAVIVLLVWVILDIFLTGVYKKKKIPNCKHRLEIRQK